MTNTHGQSNVQVTIHNIYSNKLLVFSCLELHHLKVFTKMHIPREAAI